MRFKILIFLLGISFYSCQSDDDFRSDIAVEEKEEVIEEVVVDTVVTDFAGKV